MSQTITLAGLSLKEIEAAIASGTPVTQAIAELDARLARPSCTGTKRTRTQAMRDQLAAGQVQGAAKAAFAQAFPHSVAAKPADYIAACSDVAELEAIAALAAKRAADLRTQAARANAKVAQPALAADLMNTIAGLQAQIAALQPKKRAAKKAA